MARLTSQGVCCDCSHTKSSQEQLNPDLMLLQGSKPAPSEVTDLNVER